MIGRRLCPHLAQAGYEVVVLSRDPERARDGLPPSVAVESWDGQEAAAWAELLDGALAVINLAGVNLAGEGLLPARWTAQRKEAIRQSRLKAGRAIMQAVEAARDKPQVLLQASAVGYYGSPGEAQCTEESPAGSDFLARLCLAWEASTQAAEALGVRRVILRTAVVLDPSSGALLRLLLPYRLFLGGPMGSGRQWLPWIHPLDVTRAIEFLLEHQEARGPFNLVAPQAVRNRDFARTLGRVLRRPSWLPVPGFALRLILGEVADTVLKGQRVFPKRLLDMGFQFAHPELEGALRDLLLNPG
jgi:hypothetical protein